MRRPSHAKSCILLLLTVATLGLGGGWAGEAAAADGVDAVDLVLEGLAEAAGTAPSTAPSCTVGLVQAPPEGEALCVYFDDTISVPENPRNGWTYSRDRNAVTFHGSSCDGIQSGRVREVDIVCGCAR